MDKDLLHLIKEIKGVKSIDQLENIKELSNAILRNKKREAMMTILAISEEMGKEEILNSIKDLSGYLESIVDKGEK
ncbi:hypothetical protein [uncultured Kordia sp.]|uniref:hypothetical protein n=1 Tax=uncultured Kordia sp. TaxID=507699 RepID=UPI00261C1DD8|nr:hypothetical protein [uncultured Kordia sp.]